jgi:hypothetical protein
MKNVLAKKQKEVFMTTKILVDQHTSNHLIEIFSKNGSIIKSIQEITSCELLIDLTLNSNKLEILKKCEDEDVAALIDTSCVDNSSFLSHKALIGCCAFHLAPTHNIEFTPGRFANFKNEIENMFKVSFVNYIHPSTGFVFGRIFSMVINETYLAYESKVATIADIDRAMQFGVNYPFGPAQFALGKEIFIATLLNNLAKKSTGQRYEMSLYLQNFIKEIH